MVSARYTETGINNEGNSYIIFSITLDEPINSGNYAQVFITQTDFDDGQPVSSVTAAKVWNTSEISDDRGWSYGEEPWGYEMLCRYDAPSNLAPNRSGYLYTWNVGYSTGEAVYNINSVTVPFAGVRYVEQDGYSVKIQIILSNHINSINYSSIAICSNLQEDSATQLQGENISVPITSSSFENFAASITRQYDEHFSNLTGEKTFYVYAQAANGAYYYVGEFSAEFEALPTLTIAPWDWHSSNGSATAEETEAAYSAIEDRGKVSDFSYKVWNDLVDKATEVAEAMGTTTDIENCKMTSNNKTLTAAKFNPLYGLAAYIDTEDLSMIISVSVNTGDPVRGKYFTNIADWINYRIGILNNQK